MYTTGFNNQNPARFICFQILNPYYLKETILHKLEPIPPVHMLNAKKNSNVICLSGNWKKIYFKHAKFHWRTENWAHNLLSYTNFHTILGHKHVTIEAIRFPHITCTQNLNFHVAFRQVEGNILCAHKIHSTIETQQDVYAFKCKPL